MKKVKWATIRSNIIAAYDNSANQRAKAGKQQWKRNERKVFLSHLKSEKKKKLLEIGAGTGRDSFYFKKHGLKVTTTDISSANVQYCRRRGLSAFVLDIYDVQKLRKKFDAIYALNCLIHVPRVDFERMLKKIKRLLKPGGLFYLGMYGGVAFEGVHKKDRCRPKRFFSFYQTKDILAIVQKHYKLEYFKHVTPWKDGGTFQSIILRKKKRRE